MRPLDSLERKPDQGGSALDNSEGDKGRETIVLMLSLL